MEKSERQNKNTGQRCMVRHWLLCNLRSFGLLGNRIGVFGRVCPLVTVKSCPGALNTDDHSASLSSSVIGLYTSYAAPIFLRITSGRDKLVPGPFSLGRWAVPIGAIAVSWVSFIVVMLLFPPGQTTDAEDMSE